MEQVYLRYPEDSEAAVFYALAMNEAVTVLPADPNFTRQLKGRGDSREGACGKSGASWRASLSDSQLRLPGAGGSRTWQRQRSDTATWPPAAPHALHMPSHAYSMLGMWQESIKANQAALAVAEGYAHALDFMVYAYLQWAQDVEAKRGSRTEHGVAKNSERIRCGQSDWGRVGRLHGTRGDSRALCD